jgi:hypothetical protein
MRLSLVKTKDNAALPSAKKGIITLIHVDQIIAMPETDDRGIRCVNELQLIENAEFQYLYLTPFTQKEEISPIGEVESTLFLPKVSGTYPGNKIGAAEFLKENINEPFIMVYDDCTENSRIIYGTKHQPMYMKPDYKSDSTGKLWNFIFEQSEATDTPFLLYSGAVPDVGPLPETILNLYTYGFIDDSAE